MKVTTAATTAATITAALVLAGCGTDDGTAEPTTPPTAPASAAPAAPSAPSAPSAPYNDADVAFVQGMIPHHAQAVQMAQLAPGRADDERVGQLAVRIEQAQGPEIARMRSLLAGWGVAGGTDPSGMGGMMSDQQMQQLTQARGAAFDRMFLQMMTAHHDGAVQMARTELDRGSDPGARALAREIIDAQQAEIAEMRQLLGA